MAEKETAMDDVSYQERGIDVEPGKQQADTVSQLGGETTSQFAIEETDGKATKRRKKAAQRTIQDGLLLSLKGQKQPFVSYTYTLTPGMDSSSRVDWKVLTTEAVECQHIYYHQLQPGDTVANIAAKHKKSHTVAVILGNVENSLELAAEFSEGTGKSKKNVMPMILISSEDGASLKDFLNRHDPGELHAKIESKNQTHVDLRSRASSTARGSYSPEPATLQKQPRLKSTGGIRKSMRQIMQRKSGVNLKEELKSLIYPISGPICVSEDEELFKNTMIAFYQHEQTVLREGRHGDAGSVFRKLSKYLDEQFPRDFPFYLLVAFRVNRKAVAPVYQGDELSPFVHSCVEKFEKLEPTSIVKTMESFLKKENFKIAFSSTESDQTVLKLLEEACIELMKHSFMLKTQDGSQAKYRAVYSRMLWISVAYKCHIQRGATAGEFVDYWQEHLTNTETFTHLNTDTIQSIKRGVEFGRLLQLPDEVSFSSQHMGDVLTCGGLVRPFQQIREFVIVLEPYVQLEEVFVECFLTSPRTTCYAELFKSKKEDWYKSVHPEGNLLAILQEGISFLDTVLEVSRQRQWLSKAMDDEIKEWLSMLLGPVDITSEKAESYLKDFLTTKMGGVTKLYAEHIKRDVVVKMYDSFGSLKVERFLQLYKAFLIWPTWVVQKYLGQYKMPQEVRICSSTWNEFFSEFVERFKDAHHHNFLLEFLKSVAKCYLEQGRPKEFIMDLLELNVSDLFMMDSEGSTSTIQSDVISGNVPDEFMQFLTDYIQRNNLHDAILKDVEKIWDLVVDHSNFQMLVLVVLQQELIPESLAYQGTMSAPLKFLLQQCVATICKNLSSLCDLSSRLEFCWGVVGSCCSKMPVTESLEWAKSYYQIIDQLGRIYSVFRQAQAHEETKSVLDDESMPLDVAQSNSEGVQSFFKWLAKVQKVLATWRERFTSKQVNYDSIILYVEAYGLLNRAATYLSANTLIVEEHYVKAIQADFLQAFELLNMLLIRYIDGQPEAGYCSLYEILSKYGVELPPPLLMTIKKHVFFPGESNNKRILSPEHSIPSSISNNFNPGQDIKLEITTEMDLLQLKNLVRQLTTFLSPVEDNLELLTFFFQTNSEIFDKYLKHQLKILEAAKHPKEHSDSPKKILPDMLPEKRREKFSGISIEMLGKALENTREFIVRLIQGNAMYTEIIASGSLNLRSIDIDHEFGILNSYGEYATINMKDAEGLQGIRAMLQLFQYKRHIQVIHNVCEQYQLEACLSDPDLTELMELVAMLDEAETQNKLTAKDAINRMTKVAELLYLNVKQGESAKFLDLFAAVSDSADFHQFIVHEKQFVGKEGKDLFHQQYQLIITQLQHEEYNEVVLNHLFAAFKMITPFTEKDLEFGALMAKVSELNAYDGRRQLETVNRNINLIRLWFTRAEGDTLQGVSSELRCVLESGFYRFHFSSSVDYISGSVQLVYMPHLYQSVGEVMDTPSLSGMVVWNDEQISDFVRKLGFLDAEGDTAFQIKQFLHLNQTAKKLLDVFSKLRELGHPEFLQQNVKYDLHCTFTQDEADEMVYDASTRLTEWKQMVNNLRSEYEQLLYFSIPKLLHLYQNLVGGKPSVSRIANDVTILFQNKSDVQRKLRHTIKDLIRTRAYLFQEQDSDSTPMHLVGAFLSAIFENTDLSTNSLKRRRASSAISRSLSQQSTHILHSCQHFTPSQLLRTVISIFGGVPEPFEVFHCRPTVTEEELRLFLNPKRATKHPFQYLILEVNKLPYQLQEALLRIHYDLKQHQQAQAAQGGEVEVPCTHFVETAPSLLQEMPWVLHMDYKGAEPSLDFKQAGITCQKSALSSEDFECLKLVYGEAGDGKTHYIENELKHAPHSLKIAVNEAFTPLGAIKKLACELPSDVPNCAVYFNFTMLPPGESVDDEERQRYNSLIETVGWFFFDLFILGYVEDPVTGYSFRFPGGMKWAIYVEVPSRIKMNSNMSLMEFFEDIPALGLLGTPYLVEPSVPYVVDEEVQLVCKYLRAFKIGGTKGINKLYREGGVLSAKSKVPNKFSLDTDLSESDCHKLLNHYTPQHMKRNKTSQKLFIRYMKRRCSFLDKCPAFNFNGGSTEYITSSDGKKRKNDTTQLGSTLMETMLREVSDFCDPIIRENWSLKPHHQLIYDFKDGGGSFGLLSLHPEEIATEDKEKFKKIGVDIPSMLELYSRDKLDSYLSRALNVPLDTKNNRLGIIDDSNYVLTLDFAIKMLNIHERAECGVPVIIEGETGVGKTALIEMLSKLWNFSLIKNWSLFKDRTLTFVKKRLDALPQECLRNSPGCHDALTALATGRAIIEDDLIMLGEIQLDDGSQFSSILREHLYSLVGDPMLSMLDLRQEDIEPGGVDTVTMLVASVKYKNNPKEIAKVLYRLLNCNVKEFFYKLNVHAALEPSQIVDFFEPVFEKAKELERAYDRFSDQTKVPFITVFLDEVNTSSCLGLFKEVIVDRTIDGKPIPNNIFVIGACNPHRGNSLATVLRKETWIRGAYYVRQLHPTLQCLMWDYGALGEKQEREYIAAKMRMSNRNASNSDQATLTELILKSQSLMRKYSFEQLQECGLSDSDASDCSRSCVSQRDIQRVFTFYEWLYKMYMRYKPAASACDYSFRAMLVSLGLVYYLRLDTKYRKKYHSVLDHEAAPAQESFSRSFEEELNWYIDHIDLPDGIAKTQALKENLFATIVCTMTHTPLIIVGQPGSSKTLSFNLALANLKGQESKINVFRQTDIFKSLDPQFYQCSRRTTSNEIQTVFQRAINRQRSHQRVPLPVYCVVFMDEAGLPEERHESLKVLHFYLDKQEVSFVAISNHVLDAAKTNRAVSLFRPEVTQDDLVTLAKGCLCQTPDDPPPELKRDLEFVANLVPAYDSLMRREKFKQFFGLRDFIHFISYLKRKRTQMLSPQLVLEALERNFNGVKKKDFDAICKIFLHRVQASKKDLDSLNVLDILLGSLLDHPEECGSENEMRYKLIIDSSEDGSLVRLLFSTGVLERDRTRVYMCSDFPGDAQLQKVNTIAAVRHSATEGHTVVLSQTDSIHESFYDLFNRRFHRIDANTGPRYYANIAIGAHIKPCRVHKEFECLVVVKESDLDSMSIPQPFLNRFEKYRLSHEIVLEATLASFPPALSQMLKAVLNKTNEFLDLIGHSASIYGLHKDTVSSLLLTMLPPLEHDYSSHCYKQPSKSTPAYEVRNRVMEMTLEALKKNAGFVIPECSAEELNTDMREVLNQVLRDSEFAGRVLLMTSETYYDSTGDIYKAVTEAFNALHDPHAEININQDVSINALLIVSAVTQLLVRLLCKKVMQLMTSDSLCVHHRRVPTPYIQNYLNYQCHFSLKSLIESRRKFLKSTTNPNKLICYTRSSQLLHQLPTQYPSPLHQAASEEAVSMLHDIVTPDVASLTFQKLSSFTSFTTISELLKSFMSSSSKEVLVMTVNMQETSKDVVNHLRIMIEEIESKQKGQRKLFILLLHFPSSKLSTPAYTSLFLRGWDYVYLDVIGISSQGGALIDIREWFKQCYTTTAFPSTRRSIATQLQSLLREAIPVISSRVYFGKNPDSSFNKPMNVMERNVMLQKLFFSKKVGEILCDRFHSYWQPNVMVEYLEKAAQLSQQHETSLSVIDSLQTIFKNLFFDFLVHMVYKMNQGMNIDVLFNTDSSSNVVELFLSVLRTIPIPKLSEIKMLGVSSGDMKNSDGTLAPPKFPFFFLIASDVEKLVDQSRREMNQSVDMLGEYSEPRPSLFHTAEQSRVQVMADMLKIIQTKLEDLTKAEEKTCISLTVQALIRSDDLWQKYLEDFTRQKLRLEFGNTGISHKILRAAFGKLEKRNAVQRLALLHVYVHMHRVNLAKVVSILRPLDQIEVAVSVLPSLQQPHSIQSPNHGLLDKSGSEDVLESSEALSVFIISTLFNAISGIGMSCSSSLNPHVGTREEQEIKVWFQAYRDVISMPALTEHIYGSRSNTAEAQHSIMHALFLVIRSKPSKCSENLQQGLKIFNRLFDEYFKATMELQNASNSPRLGDITRIILEELSGYSTSYGTTTDPAQIRHIMEGLLAHFFSLHQTSYHPDDIRWLLEMANLQTHWQATYLMSEIVEVEYSADLLSKTDGEPETATVYSDISSKSCPHKLFVHIPISIFKFYLHRILLASLRVRDDPVHSIMLFFQNTEVHSVIAQVLFPRQANQERTVGPYIPTFYQFFDSILHCATSDNELMQQPLAHLYFLTVFEDLLSSSFSLPNLIRTSQKIAKQCAVASMPEEQLVLLHIEQQAMVQVIIKEVANHLDFRDNSKINTLYSILEDLNAILDNTQLGGGEVGGHGLVLAMHMLKEQQSFGKFINLLTENYSHLCDGINCLQPFHKALSQAHSSMLKSEIHGSSSSLDLGVDFQTLYQRVSAVMNAIQHTHGTPAKAKELVRIMDECSSSSAHLTITAPSSGQPAQLKKSACFKMILWLVTYHEFFAKNRAAPELAQVVSSLKKVEPHCLQLICCFLDPSRMIKQDQEDSETKVDSPRQSQTPQDSLYQLLCPLPANEDQSDSDLRAVLVHLIAVTLACSRSTHLWYSIFHPDELINTYLPGFMYDSVVGPSTQFFDSGVELTPEGLYGRHDYLKHVTRGTLSLPSLYLILWSDFASFSLSLLTQPSAQKQLSGKILSNSEPPREYCVAQMKKLWSLLRSGLGISDEERLVLVQGCLNSLLENATKKSNMGLGGKLLNSRELDAYETMWHTQIFTPSWSALEKQFSEKSPFLRLKVIKDIRTMNVRYPWFPSEHTLTMSILSNAGLTDPSGDLYPLSRFVLEYPRLRGGMELLPGIVELYQYLHTEFTYAITYKEATTISLKRLAKVIAKHFVTSGDRKAHYEKLKAAFNKYVLLTGCTRYKRPSTVSDETPLLHLLSYSVDGEQGSDLLYTVIVDIITFLNKFITSLMETLENSELCRNHFPNTPPKVHVMEFAQHYMQALAPHRRNHLLQLILSRSHLPMAFPTDPTQMSLPPHHGYLPGQLGPLMNLCNLQEDILVTCLAGMPLIEPSSVSSIRTPFMFKDDGAAQFSLRDHAVDLEAIGEKLPEQFKTGLKEDTKKRMEYEFHSACYHTVMEVMAGLRTSIGHLIKEVSVVDFDVKSSKLLRMSLPAYLTGLYEYDPQDETKDVFHEIGIHGITQTQHGALSSLKLPHLFAALRLFVDWAEDGWYDFCSLPFAAKSPLTLVDEETISQISDKFDGTPNQLLHNLKTLVDVLSHMENTIVKTITDKSHDSIIRFLLRFPEVLPRDSRKLTDLIPQTVRLENYVALRIALRKLTNEVQAQVSRSEACSIPEPKEEKWSALVDDLWEVHLPYFRKRGYVVSSRPSSSNSFSQEPDPSTTILSELTRRDSDQNLLALLKKDSPMVKRAPPSPLPDPGANREERNLELLKKLTTQVKAEDMQRRAKDFTLQDILAFLETKGLAHYGKLFEEFDINGELLIQFHDDELRDMGIESALDRLRISTYFRRHVIKSEGLAELYPVEAVVQFLQETRPLQQFAPTFQEQQIDGELLLNASNDVMNELGVEKGVHKLMIRQKFKARLD